MAISATTAAYITAAAAVAGASTTAYGAYAQNQNVKKAKKDAATAAAINKRQLSDQRSVEQMKREQESQRVKAAIRAAATSAGAGFDSSSYSALVTQAEIDRSTNAAIADQSFTNNLARITSGLNATVNELDSRRQNVLISGLLGGLQGAQAGYAISGGLADLFPPEPAGGSIPIDQSYMPGSTAFGSNRPR